jgi:hypothetical protein
MWTGVGMREIEGEIEIDRVIGVREERGVGGCVNG